MTNEFSSVNLHHLKELEKRFKKQKEELPNKKLFEFNEELKSIGEKIEELAIEYSYVEVLAMAKKYSIRAGPKVQMLRKLLEKGVNEIEC
jgi:ribosomal protein S25